MSEEFTYNGRSLHTLFIQRASLEKVFSPIRLGLVKKKKKKTNRRFPRTSVSLIAWARFTKMKACQWRRKPTKPKNP